VSCSVLLGLISALNKTGDFRLWNSGPEPLLPIGLEQGGRLVLDGAPTGSSVPLTVYPWAAVVSFLESREEAAGASEAAFESHRQNTQVGRD